ncbi:MAG: ATP-dependent Clp protease ATP-binding subunit [Candidatus Brennerbacteria bacterium]|nr:ATP-dependent Clp protease ATP-binding subunit [Candidatus Brennerbacteria bacterium]
MTELFFKEPRLALTKGGEFLTRLVAYSFYIALTAAAVLLLFSDLSPLKWLAVLITLFLIDRAIHLGEAEKSIREISGGEKINLAEAVTPAAYRLLNHAFRKSLMAHEDFHLSLLRALIMRGDVREALKRLSISADECLGKVEEYLERSKKYDRKEIANLVEKLVVAAYENAVRTGEKFIEPRNLFVALCSAPEGAPSGGNPRIAKLFELFDITQKDLEEAVVFGRYRRIFARVHRLPAVLGGFAHRPRLLRKRVVNRAWTSRPTPTLDDFSTDLTALARAEKVGFLVGHKKEFDSMLDVISRPGKPNVLLVGEAGGGKSTMVHHLAFRMVKDDVPPVLFDKRLLALELSSLLSNAPVEVLSARLRKIAEEIILAGNIVLFIPNIHDLFRTAEKDTLNAIDILLPIVKSGEIPLIGETYPKEFKRYIEPRSDFLDQFEVVEVGEISKEEALRFLVHLSLILEREFKVFITLRAVSKAVELASRYFREKTLPGSAVDLLKQALARASEEKLKVLEENLVVEIAEEQSKIPIEKAGAEETAKLLDLENIIHKRLVNQETAVKAVSRALREYRSGLSRAGGPIAVFLFVGPTGVGKTELAKILTSTMFGSKESMERFDMSEYQVKESVFRLIGNPDGSRTGTLTDAILKRPYSLILLDEFEKSHPDVLNVFLQVFDDGRLTDSLGRTANFENTIIIATSNAHSNFIKEEVEKGRTIEGLSEELKKKLTEYFKPELLNRFSDVIVFRNLTVEEIFVIAGFLIKEVAEVLKETHGIELTVDEAATREFARLGWSPVYGARPLRQVISEKIKSPLAEKILKKELARGNEVLFTFSKDRFEFKLVS